MTSDSSRSDAQISGKILKIDLDGRRVCALDCFGVLLYLRGQIHERRDDGDRSDNLRKITKYGRPFDQRHGSPQTDRPDCYDSPRLADWDAGESLECCMRHGSPPMR